MIVLGRLITLIGLLCGFGGGMGVISALLITGWPSHSLLDSTTQVIVILGVLLGLGFAATTASMVRVIRKFKT